MKCANCGTESDGRFCPSCGASLQQSTCTSCGASLVSGARFCTQCGTATSGTAPRAATRSMVPWYLAVGVLALLVVILVVPLLTRDSTSATPGPLPTPGTSDGSPPPLTGTPRDQADRLFNRIMTAVNQGDTAEARRFTPMAVSAYGMAAPLDDDGLFHLASIHLVAGDYDAALASAGDILSSNPDHILGLAVAGEAAALSGDDASAREFYSRLLAAYDTEIAAGRQEYEDHAQILPTFRDAARRVTGDR